MYRISTPPLPTIIPLTLSHNYLYDVCFYIALASPSFQSLHVCLLTALSRCYHLAKIHGLHPLLYVILLPSASLLAFPSQVLLCALSCSSPSVCLFHHRIHDGYSLHMMFQPHVLLILHLQCVIPSHNLPILPPYPEDIHILLSSYHSSMYG